jgi:hypothetical protein
MHRRQPSASSQKKVAPAHVKIIFGVSGYSLIKLVALFSIPR